MIFKNGFVLDKSFHFVQTELQIKNGKIVAVGCGEPDTEVVNCTGKYLIPGLVDIHTHGCGGADACDGTKEALDILSDTQGKAGITSFCATSMTLPEEDLEHIFENIRQYMAGTPKRAHIIGINMEGPFFNECRKGAQRADCLRLPDANFFRKLNNCLLYTSRCV